MCYCAAWVDAQDRERSVPGAPGILILDTFERVRIRPLNQRKADLDFFVTVAVTDAEALQRAVGGSRCFVNLYFPFHGALAEARRILPTDDVRLVSASRRDRAQHVARLVAQGGPPKEGWFLNPDALMSDKWSSYGLRVDDALDLLATPLLKRQSDLVDARRAASHYDGGGLGVLTFQLDFGRILEHEASTLAKAPPQLVTLWVRIQGALADAPASTDFGLLRIPWAKLAGGAAPMLDYADQTYHLARRGEAWAIEGNECLDVFLYAIDVEPARGAVHKFLVKPTSGGHPYAVNAFETHGRQDKDHFWYRRRYSVAASDLRPAVLHLHLAWLRPGEVFALSVLVGTLLGLAARAGWLILTGAR